MTTSLPPSDIAAAEALVADSEPAGGWPPLRHGFLGFLAVAALAEGIGQLTPLVLTLPLKAAAIDRAHQATVFSVAAGIASLLTLIAYPLFGRLSDRTVSRLGRRRPFLLLGAALIAVASIVQFLAFDTLTLTIAAVFVFVGAAAVVVALTAIIPDQIEPLRRGPASALAGVGPLLGAVIGLFIAQAVPGLAWAIFAPAAVSVAGILLFALTLKERPITRAERPPLSFVILLSTFWTNPVRNPNFAWAWFSRLLIFFGISAIQAYQLFYLVARLHFTAATVSLAVALSSLVLVVVALVFSAIGARISDRVGRRKPFVIVAAIVFAAGLVLASVVTTFPAFLLTIAIIGAGQGTYLAVDLALVSQVLPDPGNPAKDMGIFGLANILPSALVPAVAPALLLIGATASNPQNYPSLFLAGAIAGLVGAVLILPIRKVR